MKICILGATGLVGAELLDLIPRAWPDAELELYASRDQSLSHGGKDLPVRAASALEEESATGGDLAFVALDDEHSARYVPRLRQLGYRVVDKSNTYRLNPEVPLVVAGVNEQAVSPEDTLIANPNCTTIPLCIALAPIKAAFGLSSLAVSSYQAISGAGVRALDSFLEAQAEGAEARDRLGRPYATAGYAGNVVPHNGKTDESGYSSEERKLMRESVKILDAPNLRVSAQCCRVPVAVGHYENVWLTTHKAAAVSELEEALHAAQSPRLIVHRGAEGSELSARACLESRDAALVGRLRPDARDSEGRAFCLTVAADNLRLGAATNAVRAASVWFPSADPELGLASEA